MTPDIERLAKEAGIHPIPNKGPFPPDFTPPIWYIESTDQLAKFAALIAEACAKECDGYVWWENDGHSPDEGNIRCAGLIRAKFPIPAHSDTKDAAK